jgi:hypothetical protein
MDNRKIGGFSSGENVENDTTQLKQEYERAMKAIENALARIERQLQENNTEVIKRETDEK